MLGLNKVIFSYGYAIRIYYFTKTKLFFECLLFFE